MRYEVQSMKTMFNLKPIIKMLHNLFRAERWQIWNKAMIVLYSMTSIEHKFYDYYLNFKFKSLSYCTTNSKTLLLQKKVSYTQHTGIWLTKTLVQIKLKIGRGKIKIRNTRVKSWCKEIRWLERFLWVSNSFELALMLRDD